ncbi:C-X-C motif chemokine 16 [Grammomys surdaster]|uniref:C-X-C motif chemokine 16 n=1 Tax=Grammomys surdaster TaxID=491861 RepID=UPI0010A04D2D|nr:C-X-C motif chemokine 16 [Grammomys surdaster]
MRRGFGPLPLAFLLALLTLPGDGNQGSVSGGCSCDRTIPSGTQIPPGTLDHIRKYLKAFHRCPFFISFQLQSKSVCGRSQDQWVRELVNCFEHKECGTDHEKSFHHQKHLPQASIGIPEATEGTLAGTSTPAPIQSTQQSTLPSGALSLNKQLTQHRETTILPLGYGLEAGPEAKDKQQDDKQQKEPGAGTRALVPVLSLLAIVFFLIAAMVYMLCNRRVTRQSSAGVQLCYTPVEPRPQRLEQEWKLVRDDLGEVADRAAG